MDVAVIIVNVIVLVKLLLAGTKSRVQQMKCVILIANCGVYNTTKK